MVPAKQFHLNATTALTSGESYASYVPIFAELRATSFKSESADGSAEIQDPAAKSMGARKLLTSTMRNLPPHAARVAPGDTATVVTVSPRGREKTGPSRSWSPGRRNVARSARRALSKLLSTQS